MIEKWGVRTNSILSKSYVAFWLFVLVSCEYNDLKEPIEYNCSASTLSLSLRKSIPSACISSTGEIEVVASGGVFPYTYSISGSSAQQSSTFSNLSAGLYSIVVFDAKSCSDTVSYLLSNLQSNLSAFYSTTSDTGCLTNTGSCVVHVKGGQPPYQFQLQSEPITTDSIFTNLEFGNYTITIKDGAQCLFSLDVTVPRGFTEVSWLRDIKPIVDLSCAKSGCHVEGSGRADFTQFEAVKGMANQIKSRVVSRSMPFDSRLPDEAIQLISCWVDDGALEN